MGREHLAFVWNICRRYLEIETVQKHTVTSPPKEQYVYPLIGMARFDTRVCEKSTDCGITELFFPDFEIQKNSRELKK